jgi:hypothetical protein
MEGAGRNDAPPKIILTASGAQCYFFITDSAWKAFAELVTLKPNSGEEIHDVATVCSRIFSL